MVGRFIDLHNYPGKIKISPGEPVVELVEVSIVVPLFNEVENVRLLYDNLKPVIESLDKTSEIIFVDDGSTDGTYLLLQ